jgi:hypothetical protein
MGALLPSGLNPKTFAFHPSLADLQRRRERARCRYDAILAGPGLTDADKDFLLLSPPGEDAWWDVLLGSTSGTGQGAMRVLYAGLLAFWEAMFVTRAMDWAGDPMRQEADAPLPITECYAAWTGLRSGRWVPCLSQELMPRIRKPPDQGREPDGRCRRRGRAFAEGVIMNGRGGRFVGTGGLTKKQQKFIHAYVENGGQRVRPLPARPATGCRPTGAGPFTVS